MTNGVATYDNATEEQVAKGPRDGQGHKIKGNDTRQHMVALEM